MLTLNKYLRELGINEQSWPFNETKENQDKKNIGKHYDNRYIPDENGFINAETFSLDYTLALIIYSYLCYFRDNCMSISVPAYLTMKNGRDMGIEYGSKKWRDIIDHMIEGFKMYITFEDKAPQITDYNLTETDFERWKRDLKKYTRKMNYGIRLFAKHFGSLNW